MTPARLFQILAILGWTVRRLATEHIARDYDEAKEWAKGRAPIPADVAEWLDWYVVVWDKRPRRRASS